MPEKMLSEIRFYRIISMVLGTLLLGVACWIGDSSSHIPGMEIEMRNALTELSDHETRIRILESKK